jgi:chromosome partitioning protein
VSLTVLSVINLKGGAGKTTTAAFVAHALHERGLRVLGVDADPQSSLLTWSEAAAFPFPVVGLPSAKLHREVEGIAEGRYDVVVIDTPPTEHGRAIALSAARAATHVLVPVAPTPIEYQRLQGLATLFEDATDLRPDGEPPIIGVLLVKTEAGASSTRVYRGAMTGDGWPVLRGHVGKLERFAQSFGEPITNASSTGYGDAVAELLALEVPA